MTDDLEMSNMLLRSDIEEGLTPSDFFIEMSKWLGTIPTKKQWEAFARVYDFGEEEPGYTIDKNGRRHDKTTGRFVKGG